MSVSSIPGPLLTVAMRHGWQGNPADRVGLADALERARRLLPSRKVEGLSLTELVNDLYFVEQKMLVSGTINSLRLEAEQESSERGVTATAEDLSALSKLDLMEKLVAIHNEEARLEIELIKRTKADPELAAYAYKEKATE
jgi:hypothetical protein